MSCLDALQADKGTSGLLQPTPSEGLQTWHHYTQSARHLPPDPATFSDDYGPDEAAGTRATPLHQDLSGTTGLSGAADAAADSEATVVPSERLRAQRSRGRTKPENTAARGRLDHATFLERADQSVDALDSDSSFTCRGTRDGRKGGRVMGGRGDA